MLKAGSRGVFGPLLAPLRAASLGLSTSLVRSRSLFSVPAVTAVPLREGSGCCGGHHHGHAHHHDHPVPAEEAPPRASPLRLQTVKSSAAPAAAAPVGGDGSVPFRSNSAVEKTVCDPYELGGKPLPLALVKEQMMMLDKAWVYDEEGTCLRRVVSFVPMHRRSLAEQEAHAKKPLPAALRFPQPAAPGAAVGPIEGAAACAHFVQVVTNICVNNDHWVRSLTVLPHKCEVTVELRTNGRRGLTHADFYIALQVDAALLSTFRHY